MVGGPLGNVGMKALAVFYDGSKQPQLAAFPQFALEPAREFIAGLGFDRDLAIGTKLRAQPGKQQTDEMVNLSNGRDGALAAATAGTLFDANGGRNAGDEIHVRARELLDELPCIKAHRIEKTPLAFGEDQVESQSAFA